MVGGGRGTTQCNWFVTPIPIQTLYFVTHSSTWTIFLTCCKCWISHVPSSNDIVAGIVCNSWGWGPGQQINLDFGKAFQTHIEPIGCIIIISTQVSRTHTHWNVWQNVTWSVVQSNFCSAGMICMGLQSLVWKCGTSLETEF